MTVFAANDNKPQSPASLEAIEFKVRMEAEDLLRALQIDIDSDANSQNTARRYAKMLVQEVFKGRYSEPPQLTVFPNSKGIDELVTTGPITVRSCCSHHLCPIIGQAWIGYVPGDRLLGLSKFNRIVEWFAARGQIQEELTKQIADFIQERLNPKGLAVVIRAEHFCMTWRGVKEHGDAAMTTSCMKGLLMEKPEARAEFFSLAKL